MCIRFSQHETTSRTTQQPHCTSPVWHGAPSPWQGTLTILVAFLSLLPTASTFLFYNGFMEVNLDKETFNAGESLVGMIELGNFEGVGFNDAQVVLEVVSGGKDALAYPSQLGDDGTIISETKIPAKLAAGGQRKIPFEIPLPADLKAGTYTIDAYYAANRAPVVGIPHIFISPASTEFSVKGNGEFPQLSIVRTKTTFNGQAGPVGPPIEGGKEILGSVYVKNLTPKEIKDTTVWAGLCMWDDTSNSCDSFLSEDSEKANFSAGKEAEVKLSLRAPEMPGAYAIRIEVRDKDNRLVSLYRNRAIVVGGTARIKKMDVSTQKLESGKEAVINILLGSSPDHYTNPDFNDFDVRVWVEGGGSEKLFEKATHIDSITLAELEKELSFGFTPEETLRAFRVCASVEKIRTVFDSYCLDVAELEGGPSQEKRAGIDVNTSYNPATGTFSATVCGFGKDGQGEGLDIGMLLVEQETGEKMIDSKYIGEECYTDSVKINPSRHLLVVDDFRNASQFNRELDFSAPAQIPSCTEQGGMLCSQGEECTGATIKSREAMACCSSECRAPQTGIGVEAYPLGTDTGISGLLAPAIAIVVIVVALALGAAWMRKKNHEGTG